MKSVSKAFLVVVASAILAGAASAGDPAEGQKVFNKCRACHTVGETAKNGVGPLLNGLFGRKAGTIEGFKYSDANKASGVVWDEKNFAEYINDPKKFMPGNQMPFAGVKSEKEVENLIAFLKQFDKDGKKK